MGPLMGHRGAEPVGRLRSARVSSAERDKALQVRDLKAAGFSQESGVRCAPPLGPTSSQSTNLSGHPARVLSHGETR